MLDPDDAYAISGFNLKAALSEVLNAGEVGKS